MDSFLHDWLGLGRQPEDLEVLHVCLRAVLVFFSTLVIIRLGHKRFLARITAFDVVLGLMLASMLSRAINGSAALGPTLAGGLVLVLCHRLLSALAWYSEFIGRLVKGEPDVLVRNGQTDTGRMRKHRVTEHDLLEEARLNGKVEEITQIKTAVLERNGKISVLPAPDK